jgi:hypothetical protein
MNYSDKEHILDYFEKAVNAIPKDHPHYHEIRKLLIQQVNDDLHDETHGQADKRAS